MMKKALLWIAYWTWCLPQALIGLGLFIVRRLTLKHFKITPYKLATVKFTSPDYGAGISLSPFIFIYDYDLGDDNDMQVRMNNHEWGHVRQSLMLGPLYLLVIGIPSISWLIVNTHWLPNLDYYKSFYTEIWADRLGGVVRS